ncbi:hypothetical protein JR316_0009648 [Psilocybe cubensis]|uniref:Uncharacterized protein n=2 Tax=Psilocybe cubensis TaxID=181762 RepID=A0ACB8GPN0_PSICU|nr:hypothetical protein JR316_0009648 [Psilocybe cubensis]KAH9477435.1 hypothetical protein JR316_0009648 [Psilocybe cubensis]
MSDAPVRSDSYRGRSTGHTENSTRERTNYGVKPSLPSPTDTTSPGLAQSASNSASNSSSSPPEPTTPPRVIARPRYPADLRRVPLHRRGTSKTYERLEDLLKEAGYKETRIFTPEAERMDHRRDGGDSTKAGDDNRTSVVKDGMEAVVGFFAGLLPSAAASRTNLTTTEGENQLTASPREYSPPTSPLAKRRSFGQGGRPSLDLTEPSTASSNESFGEPTPRLIRPKNSWASKPNPTTTHPQTSPPAHQSSLIPRQSSRTSVNRQTNHAFPGPGENSMGIASPRPSRAGAYLRHMASTQSMPGRPNSTPVHLFNRNTMHSHEGDSEDPGVAYNRRGNGEGEEEGHGEPPLPPTWLETVARAVLFGGGGAYIGGPSQHNLHDPSPHVSKTRTGKTPVLRQTRSSLSQAPVRRPAKRPVASRSRLSDQTNTTGLLAPPPPLLFSMIERGRAGRSEGEVSVARVMCRSAPSSRSGSVVRGERGKERWQLGYERGRGRKKKNECDRLPSLARTQVEGDMWSRTRSGYKHGAGSMAPERWGEADGESDGVGVSSDDEDEGELDLARLLVPPKRQNSIKSLRKHLASQASAQQSLMKNFASAAAGGRRGSSANLVSSRTPSLLRRKSTIQAEEDDWDGEFSEEWGGSWAGSRRGGQGRRGSTEDDDVESFIGFFDNSRGNANTGSGRSRLGFVSAWGGGS